MQKYKLFNFIALNTYRQTISNILAFFILTLPLSSVSAQDDCGMQLAERHTDAKRTRIWASKSGEHALLFTANLDVNTDGAARSYHPDDPRGKNIALNNMGNAITKIYDSSGENVTCSPRRGDCYSLFISIFEQSRDVGYNPKRHPRFETTNIIPWKLDVNKGWKVPCTIKDGKNKGYFVSQTNLLVDKNRDECDQNRYLDSMSINAIVLPKDAIWASQGVRTDKGDLTVVRNRSNNKIVFAITGDTGPANKIGEGTVALAAALNGVTLTGNESYKEIKKLAVKKVDYLIFPKRDIPRMTGGSFNQEDIDRIGKDVFNAFGGLERVDKCIGKLGQ